jgi:TolA-binding protein
VYYNTFYHARLAFREAERLREARAPDSDPGAAELELFERAAEKSARVYELHADSKWADDALLLLGTSLHYLSKHESSQERLSEFLDRYPDSELRYQAEYTLAAVLLAKRDPVAAEGVLEGIAFADPPNELSDDAMMLMGQARHARKRYDEAADMYARALERFPSGDRRDEIEFLAAENYVVKGEPALAVRHYEAAAAGEARQVAFEASMRLVNLHIELGDNAAAFAILEALEQETPDDEPIDRVLLLKGQAFEAAGDLDQAIATYEEVATARKRTKAASEAYFRIGVIHRDDLGEVDEAVRFFKKSRDQAPRGEDARQADTALRDIRKLREYQEVISAWKRGRASAMADTGSGGAGARGGAPEGADTLAVVWEADRRGEETEVGVSPLPSLSADDGAPDAATEALPDAGGVGPSPDLGPPLPPEPGSEEGAETDEGEAEVASARFRLAELYLFAFDDSDGALDHYRVVVEEHPDTKFAQKAAFAIAWVLDHRVGDAEGAADAYRSVVADFPGTEFSVAAEEALRALESDTGEGEP